MSKEEWKQAGTNLGHAWKDFGKAVVRSADRVIEKAKDDEKADPNIVEEPNSTVFSDGTWKKTFKGLGNAFLDVGEATVNSASEIIED